MPNDERRYAARLFILCTVYTCNASTLPTLRLFLSTNIDLLMIKTFLIHQRALLPSQCSDTLTQNCLRLTIPRFLYNCLPVSCSDLALTKFLGLVLAWKLGLNVPLLP
jgi:hypothetical protein